MKRRLTASVLSLVMIVAMLLTACGPKTPSNASGSGEKTVKEDLVFALNAEPTSLDAQFAAERVTFMASRQLYDNLVKENAQGEIVPMLAESWEFINDDKSVVFKIRDDVVFHNGEPLTVEDVAFSINRTINETPNKLFSGAMENCEIIDDSHVQINLKYTFGPVLNCLAYAYFGIVCKSAVEADPEGFARNPVGSGPFKFVEWKSGDSLVFEAFPDYWRGEAAIKKVTYKVLTDISAAMISLEKGEINVLTSVPDSEKEFVLANEKLNWHETPSGFVYMVTFNNREGIFQDVRLRRAVAHAINKDELIEGALEGNGVKLIAPMASFAFGYPDESEFEELEYNPELSKQLLAEAGYPDGLKVVMKSTEAANYVKPAEIIQDQLRRVGITMELQQMERGTYLQEVYRNMEYDMSIWTMTSDYPDGDSPTFVRMHSSMYGNTNNYTGVNIPELDAALETGRFSQDQEARKAAYLTVAEITRDECPLVPLYSNMNNIACSAGLEGVRAHYGQVIDLYEYYWK